jgi:hypothetical protein
LYRDGDSEYDVAHDDLEHTPCATALALPLVPRAARSAPGRYEREVLHYVVGDPLTKLALASATHDLLAAD